MKTPRPIGFIITLFFLFIFFSCEEDNNSSPLINSDFNYLPTSTTDALVYHKYYTLSYAEKYEQAEWVAYKLDKDHISYIVLERPYFIQDDKVKTGSADWRNYKDSGYTKGHLLPAADRKFNIEAYNETFLTSNISPQIYEFNAGVWLRLEEKTRYWAQKYDELYVITGGILTSDLETIGYEAVAVPKYFYKIILDNREPEIKAIAFLMPHEESDAPIYEFVTTIDKIESLTNIDFFSILPDELENQLESSSDYKNWSFQ
ncbi:MAG: DNA/RNA non-specific endonuclease [Bacteroidota bacterium]